MPSSSRPLSRKRIRAATVVGLVCVAVCQTTTGFVVLPTTPAWRTPSHVSSSSSLSLTMKATASSTNKIMADSRPAPPPRQKQFHRQTPQEQTKLLQQAVEARRILSVQQELALTTTSASSLQAPTFRSKLAAATGYSSAAAVDAAIDAGHAARESLVTGNMGLVHYCVADILNNKGRRRTKSLQREDLLQEGAIGLARAVDRWDPAVGGRFSTYAVYWVRALVLRGIAERDHMVRVPEHMLTAVAKVTRAAKTLGLDIDNGNNGDTNLAPSWKEAAAAKALAEEAGLTDRQVQQAIQVRRRRNAGTLSFESWMQQGRDADSSFSSAVVEPETPAGVEMEHLKATLARFLRPREMEALSWRYGLNHQSTTASTPISTASGRRRAKDYMAGAEEHLFGSAEESKQQSPAVPPVRGKWGEDMSFVEVGKRMQVSAEYGRRLCHKALEKLRQAAAEGALEPALLVS